MADYHSQRYFPGKGVQISTLVPHFSGGSSRSGQQIWRWLRMEFFPLPSPLLHLSLRTVPLGFRTSGTPSPRVKPGGSHTRDARQRERGHETTRLRHEENWQAASEQAPQSEILTTDQTFYEHNKKKHRSNTSNTNIELHKENY